MRSTALNGICPYFTMFPLDFPYTILKAHATSGNWVADPFCGRGTTNYASRILGLPSLGIDSSPVAAALAKAKVANTTPVRITNAARSILEAIEEPQFVPTGDFWEWSYHPDVLKTLCRLREGLLADCRSHARVALRAVILGGLHGPLAKSGASYFSNQSPRTYAPKPNYAVQFWRNTALTPPRVNVLDVIEKRAIRYFGHEPLGAVGTIIHGDSRQKTSFASMGNRKRVQWVITSPPYYGMRTYLPDQWIRMWFMGGKDSVDYTSKQQVEHSSPDTFAMQLNQVWRNTAEVCTDDARLIIRFGAIHDRKADPMEIIKKSLSNSGWVIEKIEDAGTAADGKRQAAQFQNSKKKPISEHDVWAVRAL